MTEPAQRRLLTVDEYLASEAGSDRRHEYIDGRVYAMTGASVRHNRIAGNLFAQLHAGLRGKACEVFMADVKLRLSFAGRDIFYYPDLMVCCDPEDRAETYRTRPCLLVEVLSESTERIDQQEKLFAYLQIPSLEGYLILAQDAPRAMLHRRANDWRLEIFTAPEVVVPLPCVELAPPLASLYEGVSLP